MKKFTFLIILFSIIGCSQKDVVSFDENSIIAIEERVGDEFSSDYEVINEIEDQDTIQKIIDIFKGVRWDTNVMSMEHEPDYKLNSNYHIWVTPKGNMLEIIHTNNSYYIRLSERASSELFKIMTGKELESN